MIDRNGDASAASRGETDDKKLKGRKGEDADALRAALSHKEEEARSYIERLKRLQAEFENYKKRVRRDVNAVETQISDREIVSFLPLYDSIERAFASYSGNKDAESFIEGMERVFAQFDSFLKQKEVSPIEALGRRFDPAVHEALLSVASQEGENVILEEFERGYMRNGRLLRPSKVKVSKGKLETEEEE